MFERRPGVFLKNFGRVAAASHHQAACYIYMYMEGDTRNKEARIHCACMSIEGQMLRLDDAPVPPTLSPFNGEHATQLEEGGGVIHPLHAHRSPSFTSKNFFFQFLEPHPGPLLLLKAIFKVLHLVLRWSGLIRCLCSVSLWRSGFSV